MEEDSPGVRPELKEWVEAMTNSGEEGVLILRGLRRLYLDSKPITTEAEKLYLLFYPNDFRARAGIPIGVDNEIFLEEQRRRKADASESPAP
jgi:hypothetical protein